MKAPDEQDDLWQLLGKAKKPAVSPLFARNVLREIRLSQNEGRRENAGAFPWLRSRWRLVSLCTLAAVLLSVNASRLFVPHKAPMAAQVPQTTLPALASSKPDDTEVITHLDELIAYEENSIWLEDSSK